MTSSRKLILTITSLALLGVVAAALVRLYPSTATAQDQSQEFVYSVKFVCGTQTPASADQPPAAQPFEASDYATAIEVLNFQDGPVSVRYKVALGRQLANGPSPVSNLLAESLGPDDALHLSCADIVNLLTRDRIGAVQVIDGFVELHSPQELSVVATYTARNCSASESCEEPGTGRTSISVVPQTASTLPAPAPTP
jgi:hypothetical protein